MPWIKTERWTFTLPGPVLQRQIGVEITRRDRQEAVYRAVGLNAEGVVAELSAIAPDEPGGTKADPIWTLCLEPWKERTLALAPATQIDPIVPIFVGDWALVSVPEGDGAITHVVHISRPDVLIRMRAEGVSHSRARMRSGEGKLTICDERGRLLVIDLADGRLVRNLRVS